MNATQLIAEGFEAASPESGNDFALEFERGGVDGVVTVDFDDDGRVVAVASWDAFDESWDSDTATVSLKEWVAAVLEWFQDIVDGGPYARRPYCLK